MEFFYKYCDSLTSVPDHLVRMITQSAQNGEQAPRAAGYNSRQVVLNGELKRPLQKKPWPMPPELVDWIDENVASDYAYCSYWICSNSDTHLVHTDPHRDYVLQYLIDTGGDAVSRFYQQKGQPLVRARRVYPASYDDLEELVSVTFEPGRWHLLNGRILHDVQGMTGPRIKFDISFDHLAPDHRLLTSA